MYWLVLAIFMMVALIITVVINYIRYHRLVFPVVFAAVSALFGIWYVGESLQETLGRFCFVFIFVSFCNLMGARKFWEDNPNAHGMRHWNRS